MILDTPSYPVPSDSSLEEYRKELEKSIRDYVESELTRNLPSVDSQLSQPYPTSL